MCRRLCLVHTGSAKSPAWQPDWTWLTAPYSTSSINAATTNIVVKNSSITYQVGTYMDTQTPIDGDIWHDDLLNRKADAEFLHNFLIGKMSDRQAKDIAGSYVLNIDAEWGAGKTFFLDKFGMYLEQQGHIVVSINAWRDDYIDDPFVAILSAIDGALKPYIKQENSIKKHLQNAKKNAISIAINAGKGLLKTTAERYIGSSIAELTNTHANETAKPLLEGTFDAATKSIDKLTDKFTDQIITQFTQQNQASVNFKENLAKAIKEISEKVDVSLPLFILIDELDRCRPTYAVSLLERVKHLFDIDNVVFVFSTNSNQLQHSITGAYGDKFDGYRYLKRFFDKTYHIDNDDIYAFVRKYISETNTRQFHVPGRDNLDVNLTRFLIVAIKAYKLSLRDAKQVIDIIDTVSKGWTHNGLIEVCVLFPLIIQYFTNKDTNLDAIIEYIPDDYKLHNGYEYNGDKFFINYKDIYKKIISTMKDYQSSSQYISTQRDDPDYDYVRQFIIRENFNKISDDDLYIHSLLPLIKKAGNFVDRK